MPKEDGELTDEELEMVIGGSIDVGLAHTRLILFCLLHGIEFFSGELK